MTTRIPTPVPALAATPGVAPAKAEPLTPDLLRQIDAYWRAANYLSVGQLYLCANPLLREPLTHGACEDAAGGPLGHGAGADLRLHPPEPRHLPARPEHAVRVRPRPWRRRASSPRCTWKARWSALYPDITQDTAGLTRNCSSSFRFRAASPAMWRPPRRARIHEGGELGYSLSHAFGAVFDNPRPAGGLRGGRWRGRDRPAGHRLAGPPAAAARPPMARCCPSCT